MIELKAEIELAQEQLKNKHAEINLETETPEEIIEELPQKEEPLEEEFEEMSENDCVEGEQYDEVEKVCFYECDTDAECDAIEAKINAQLDSIGEDFFEGNKEYNDTKPTEESTIASYQINNSAISDAKAKHNEIWNEFLKIAPADFINKYFATFEIFTDGKDGTLAYVTQSENNGTKWIIGVDIEDAYKDGKLYTTDLRYSLVHEFAHVLTLNTTQVTFDTDLYNLQSADISEEVFNKQMEDAKNKCSSYFVSEGCTKTTSYFNQFFQGYWKTIYPEFETIQAIEDEEKFSIEFEEFYEKYKGQFVSDYAPTNPGEDIAESFTTFVFKDKATGNSVAQQKTNFFYNYTDLVELRTKIRRNLVN